MTYLVTGVLIATDAALVAAASVVVVWLVYSQSRTPRALVVVGLLLPLVSLVRWLPTSFVLGGRAVYFSDLLLPLGTGLVVLDRLSRSPTPPQRPLGWPLVLLSASVCGGVVLGLLGGAGTSMVLRDLRGPLYLILAFVVTALTYRDADGHRVVVTIAGVCWAAATLIAVESMGVADVLSGRVETAERVQAGASSLDAARFLVAPKDLAILVLCVTVVFVLRGFPFDRRHRFLLALTAPAAMVVFFGFSRRAVLALLVAVAFAFMVSSTSRLVVRLLVLVLVSVAVVVLGSSSFLPQTPGSYLLRQVNAFSERVVGGLSGSARSEDLGIAWRELENDYALDAARRAPVIGQGLGATFRPPVRGEPFDPGDRDFGRTYVHNLYLWLAVKLGLVGLGGYCLFVLAPVVAVVRRARRLPAERSGVVLGIAAGVLGIAAVNFVAPVSNEPATAVVLGCALGFLHVQGRRGRPRPEHSSDEIDLRSTAEAGFPWASRDLVVDDGLARASPEK